MKAFHQAALGWLLSCAIAGCGEPQTGQPNVLVVVVDDVGYSDLGFNGGVIETPTLDALAREGVVLDNFHVAPNCSPTRAMLLSGVDSHKAGLGNMAEDLSPNQQGRPGYEGHLNFSVAAMPELFGAAGYNTYMTGKWHLGMTPETAPSARGFDRSFALLPGGAGAFDNKLTLLGPGSAPYRENGKELDALPTGFYSTRFYTERMIEYIDSGRSSGKPFFGYLAYTAVHWPLQAPQASIAHYRGHFDQGYEVYRLERQQALEELGLIETNVTGFPALLGEQAWNALLAEERAYQARIMEVYAAMLHDLDVYLGKLIDYLRDTGQYDNTVIFVTSDNGPEGHTQYQGLEEFADWIDACCDNSFDNIGKPDSYVFTGPNWAQASNVPLRMYKGYVGQGGIRAPALIHYPKALRSGARSTAFATVRDVLPTLMDLAGIEHPGAGDFQGRAVHAPDGRSMLPMLEGDSERVHASDAWFGWELFGKRAIRQGRWKLTYLPSLPARDPLLPLLIKPDQWQLYDLQNDPAESIDLAGEQPEQLARMIVLWERYVAENGIVLPDVMTNY